MINLKANSINIEIISNLEDLRNKINLVLKKLESIIEDEDTIFDIKTILTELLVNGVVHGNLLDESKKVYLDMNIEEDFINICVKDEGTGFEYCIDSYNVFDLQSSGRGLLIVTNLSDEININSNKVYVRKRLKKEEKFNEHNISQTC